MKDGGTSRSGAARMHGATSDLHQVWDAVRESVVRAWRDDQEQLHSAARTRVGPYTAGPGRVFERPCQDGVAGAHDPLVEHLSVDVRASLRLFAFYLANGTLDMDLLDGFDYRSTVFHSGSSLEQVFAIYGNVLQIDADGMVLNDGDAQYRVAQWVRARCDPSYRVEPPFEDWETELHL